MDDDVDIDAAWLKGRARVWIGSKDMEDRTSMTAVGTAAGRMENI